MVTRRRHKKKVTLRCYRENDWTNLVREDNETFYNFFGNEMKELLELTVTQTVCDVCVGCDWLTDWFGFWMWKSFVFEWFGGDNCHGNWFSCSCLLDWSWLGFCCLPNSIIIVNSLGFLLIIDADKFSTNKKKRCIKCKKNVKTNFFK